MLSIDDFNEQPADQIGNDGLDAVESTDGIYLMPKKLITGLPNLRIRIYPSHSGNQTWTWNWRTSEDDLEITSERGHPTTFAWVGAETGHDEAYITTMEAALAAIQSINDHIQKNPPSQP